MLENSDIAIKIAELEKQIEKEPENKEFYDKLLWLYHQEGYYYELIELLKLSEKNNISINLNTNSYYIAEAYYNIGQNLNYKGDFKYFYNKSLYYYKIAYENNILSESYNMQHAYLWGDIKDIEIDHIISITHTYDGYDEALLVFSYHIFCIKNAKSTEDRKRYKDEFSNILYACLFEEYFVEEEIGNLLNLYSKYGFYEEIIELYYWNIKVEPEYRSKIIDNYIVTALTQKHQEEKAELQQNIMQAVSHTLGNMLYVQKGITENLASSNKLEEDIKRLQLFQTMTSSVLDSIKVAFGGNIDNNIEFFNKNNGNNISLSTLLYFSLALNLENLLFAGQEWEKKRKKLFSINSKNRKEIFNKLYEIKDNPKFQILELTDDDILTFKTFFNSDEFNFVAKYFKIDVETLNNIFVERDSYTFAIIFVIFQELIKNMFKYGSTQNNNNIIFKIMSNYNERYGENELIFENNFLNSKSKNKIGTLKGLNMIEMFAKVLGGFKNNSNNKMFSIKIKINKKYFNKG